MCMSANISPFTSPVSLIKTQPAINQLAFWPYTHSQLAPSSLGHERGTPRSRLSSDIQKIQPALLPGVPFIHSHSTVYPQPPAQAGHP